MDVLSQSDPLVVVKQFDGSSGRWMEMGRTEWQKYCTPAQKAACVRLT